MLCIQLVQLGGNIYSNSKVLLIQSVGLFRECRSSVFCGREYLPLVWLSHLANHLHAQKWTSGGRWVLITCPEVDVNVWTKYHENLSDSCWCNSLKTTAVTEKLFHLNQLSISRCLFIPLQTYSWKTKTPTWAPHPTVGRTFTPSVQGRWVHIPWSGGSVVVAGSGVQGGGCALYTMCYCKFSLKEFQTALIHSLCNSTGREIMRQSEVI